MTQLDNEVKEIISVDLDELTIHRADQLGIDLSQLANELLSNEIDRLNYAPTQNPLTDSPHP